MSEKKVLVLLGEGFEEIETVAPVDLLRRAEISCRLVSCEEGRWVKGRCGMRLEADRSLSEVSKSALFDGVVVPGGPGVGRLRKNEEVLELLKRHAAAGKLIGAICAAPTVLLAAGILPGPRYTGHFSIVETLPDLIDDQAVVVDDKIITSRGAGTAVHFGLALVSALAGPDVAKGVAASIHHQGAWKS